MSPSATPGRYPASARTAPAATAKCSPAAATTSAWKISWYPKTRGKGSGRRVA